MEFVKVGNSLPEELLNTDLKTRDGSNTSLSELIKSTYTAIIFVRHFGCLGCALQMEDLAPRLAEMKNLGLNTIVIGSGDAQYIDAFMKRYELDDQLVTVVTDSTLKSHALAGLKRHFLATLGLKGIWQQLKALLKGHSQDGVKGDNWQQGGAMVLDTTGEVLYYRKSETVGDYTPSIELVSVLHRLLINKSDPLMK